MRIPDGARLRWRVQIGTKEFDVRDDHYDSRQWLGDPKLIKGTYFKVLVFFCDEWHEAFFFLCKEGGRKCHANKDGSRWAVLRGKNKEKTNQKMKPPGPSV